MVGDPAKNPPSAVYSRIVHYPQSGGDRRNGQRRVTRLYPCAFRGHDRRRKRRTRTQDHMEHTVRLMECADFSTKRPKEIRYIETERRRVRMSNGCQPVRSS